MIEKGYFPMFAILLLALSLFNCQYAAFEDGSIRLESPAPHQLTIAVEHYNDLPEYFRTSSPISYLLVLSIISNQIVS